MPWSSKSHATDKSNVLKKSNENSLGSDISVLNYVPKQIQFGTPEAALEYLREKEKGSDFVMSDVLRQTTGVDSIEKISEETKIENKVLEKLALVQEEAYQKAYELGLEEGREKAYTERTNDINFNLSQLEEMMNHLNLLNCATQVDFLERMKNQMGREFEFLKKVRFQVSDQVTSGGCIVETNYGVVDARIEERVNKLWSEMKQALPRVKSPIT